MPASPPDSIQALMSALKLKQPAGGLPQSAPAMSSDPSQGDSDPSQGDSDPDNQDTAATNAKIVDILQTSYPKTFARISQMLDDDPDTQTDGPPSATMMG